MPVLAAMLDARAFRCLHVPPNLPEGRTECACVARTETELETAERFTVSTALPCSHPFRVSSATSGEGILGGQESCLCFGHVACTHHTGVIVHLLRLRKMILLYY